MILHWASYPADPSPITRILLRYINHAQSNPRSQRIQLFFVFQSCFYVKNIGSIMPDQSFVVVVLFCCPCYDATNNHTLIIPIIFVGWSIGVTWWRHQMEAFSALLAICAGNSPVTGEFPAQRPVKRNFDIFFDLRHKFCAWINGWENKREAGIWDAIAPIMTTL